MQNPIAEICQGTTIFGCTEIESKLKAMLLIFGSWTASHSIQSLIERCFASVRVLESLSFQFAFDWWSYASFPSNIRSIVFGTDIIYATVPQSQAASYPWTCAEKEKIIAYLKRLVRALFNLLLFTLRIFVCKSIRRIFAIDTTWTNRHLLSDSIKEDVLIRPFVSLSYYRELRPIKTALSSGAKPPPGHP